MKDLRYKNSGRKKNGELSENRTFGLKSAPKLKKDVEWWDFWTGTNRKRFKK